MGRNQIPRCRPPAVEHLHLVRDDLGRIAILSALVLPLAGLQASLHADLGPLLQVFADDLRKTPVENDPVPLGALHGLPARLWKAEGKFSAFLATCQPESGCVA